jgi:hypothetical protein
MMPSTDPSKLTYIEIPAALPLPWQPINPPPERVELALIAKTRIGWIWWPFPLLAGLGVICVVLLPFVLPYASWSASSLLAVLAWLMVAALGIGAGASLLTVIADRFRGPALLRIDATGVLDRRATERTIPWSEIASARLYFLKGTVGAVRLKLRHAVYARHNPFRRGALFFGWRLQPNEVHMPVVDLDVKARTVALAILKLVELNGGKIEAGYPFEPSI